MAEAKEIAVAVALALAVGRGSGSSSDNGRGPHSTGELLGAVGGGGRDGGKVSGG